MTPKDFTNKFDRLESTTANAPEVLQPTPEENKKIGKIKPISVYLNEEQLAYIDQIKDFAGATRHAVIQYAVRELIRNWQAGRKPEFTITHKLK
jgi:hypothetical protein